LRDLVLRLRVRHLPGAESGGASGDETTVEGRDAVRGDDIVMLQRYAEAYRTVILLWLREERRESKGFSISK
jgi:hypothetical protein